MILAEEEAKSKWCPLARVVLPQASGNRDWIKGDCVTGVATCIGSACMAWRKAHAFDKGDNLPGYCGAFGEPK